ncbi:MAG: hypothetical protein RIE73_31745 [Coleofasciculus sp. C1-SOL-03]
MLRLCLLIRELTYRAAMTRIMLSCSISDRALLMLPKRCPD